MEFHHQEIHALKADCKLVKPNLKLVKLHHSIAKECVDYAIFATPLKQPMYLNVELSAPWELQNVPKFVKKGKNNVWLVASFRFSEFEIVSMNLSCHYFK